MPEVRHLLGAGTFILEFKNFTLCNTLLFSFPSFQQEFLQSEVFEYEHGKSDLQQKPTGSSGNTESKSASKVRDFFRIPCIHTYLIDHSPLGLFRANETNN